MDRSQFDTLITRLASTPLTRAMALRGLAAGAGAALIGVSLTANDAGADRKKPKKVKICHRGDDFAILGTTKKLEKTKMRQHLKKHSADYRGQCTETITVPGSAPAPGPGPGSGPAPVPGGCTGNADCPGRICIGGVCRGGEACTTEGAECFGPSSPLTCARIETDGLACILEAQGFGLCDTGSAATTWKGWAGYNCATATTCDAVCGDAEVNNVNPYCLLGVCVVDFNSAACNACEGGNFSGICVEPMYPGNQCQSHT
jgi:hypothetical protein